jgi:hypothetical protein
MGFWNTQITIQQVMSIYSQRWIMNTITLKVYKHLNIPLPFVVEILQIRWTRLREQRIPF